MLLLPDDAFTIQIAYYRPNAEVLATQGLLTLLQDGASENDPNYMYFGFGYAIGATSYPKRPKYKIGATHLDFALAFTNNLFTLLSIRVDRKGETVFF